MDEATSAATIPSEISAPSQFRQTKSTKLSQPECFQSCALIKSNNVQWQGKGIFGLQRLHLQEGKGKGFRNASFAINKFFSKNKTRAAHNA